MLVSFSFLHQDDTVCTAMNASLMSLHSSNLMEEQIVKDGVDKDCDDFCFSSDFLIFIGRK